MYSYHVILGNLRAGQLRTLEIPLRDGVLGGRLTKTRNRTLLSNNHTKPRESHSQKATTQKTRSPATVRYGTAAAVVQLHRMQSTYAACAGAALSHKEKTLRKRTTQPKSLPPKTRRKPPEDPRANRGGRIQEDSGWAPQDFATPAVFRRVL